MPLKIGASSLFECQLPVTDAVLLTDPDKAVEILSNPSLGSGFPSDAIAEPFTIQTSLELNEVYKQLRLTECNQRSGTRGIFMQGDLSRMAYMLDVHLPPKTPRVIGAQLLRRYADLHFDCALAVISTRLVPIAYDPTDDIELIRHLA